MGLEAKRAALDALLETTLRASTTKAEVAKSRDKEEGYDRRNDTRMTVDHLSPAEIIEKYGRPGWTRTIDLFGLKVHFNGN